MTQFMLALMDVSYLLDPYMCLHLLSKASYVAECRVNRLDAFSQSGRICWKAEGGQLGRAARSDVGGDGCESTIVARWGTTHAVKPVVERWDERSARSSSSDHWNEGREGQTLHCTGICTNFRECSHAIRADTTIELLTEDSRVSL
jgi:hypothetical protein